MAYTMHTLTGQVDEVPDTLLDIPRIAKYLKVVPEGTKPLVPGLFRAGTVDEFEELNAKPEHELDAAPDAGVDGDGSDPKHVALKEDK